MSLDNSAEYYNDKKNLFSQRFRGEMTFKLILPYIADKKILHLGLGNGLMVRKIDQVASKQIVVEGSEELINEFKHDLPNTEIIHGYFESFNYNGTFDLILAAHVLEHVDNPVSLLRHLANFLNLYYGKLLITVPNAKSLHRRVGVKLGIIKSLYELHDGDKEMGHKRVYDTFGLRRDIFVSGYKIIREQGYLLKLQSLQQMMDWDDNFIDAIYNASLDCPTDVCVNLMLLCEL